VSKKKPPSEARLVANRANALKSTGPKTPEGKARSSMNAWKHGLTAKSVVLTHEYEEDFNRLAFAYRSHFLPATELELHLVDQLIVVHWHMERIRFVESFHVEQEIYNPDVAASYPDVDPDHDTHVFPAIAWRTVAENSCIFEITNRQLARLSREHARLTQTLLACRANRPPADSTIEPPVEPGLSPAAPAPSEQPVKNEANPPQPGPINSRCLKSLIRFKPKEVPVDTRTPLIACAAA
jgi:hypothetical protein